MKTEGMCLQKKRKIWILQKVVRKKNVLDKVSGGQIANQIKAI